MKKAGLVLALLLAGFTPAFAAQRPEPTLADVHSLLVGTWQNIDDTRFTREFDADGQSSDLYDGDASATTHGMWIVFSGASPPAALASAKFVANGFYLELQQNNGDVLLYQLTSANLASLEMLYLSGGNTVRYSRLK